MKREAHMDDIARLLPAARPRRLDPLDVFVCGELLVERHERPDRLELVLFGRLADEGAGTLEAQLCSDQRPSVLIDLTHLTLTGPGALCRLVDRQREEHRAGRQLLLRIAPEQVVQL